MNIYDGYKPMPSETPRTDALVGDYDFPWSYQMEMLVRHAEKLERELQESQEARKTESALRALGHDVTIRTLK